MAACDSQAGGGDRDRPAEIDGGLRLARPPELLSPVFVAGLQRHLGNQALQRLVAKRPDRPLLQRFPATKTKGKWRLNGSGTTWLSTNFPTQRSIERFWQHTSRNADDWNLGDYRALGAHARRLAAEAERLEKQRAPRGRASAQPQPEPQSEPESEEEPEAETALQEETPPEKSEESAQEQPPQLSSSLDAVEVAFDELTTEVAATESKEEEDKDETSASPERAEAQDELASIEPAEMLTMLTEVAAGDSRIGGELETTGGLFAVDESFKPEFGRLMRAWWNADPHGVIATAGDFEGRPAVDMTLDNVDERNCPVEFRLAPFPVEKLGSDEFLQYVQSVDQAIGGFYAAKRLDRITGAGWTLSDTFTNVVGHHLSSIKVEAAGGGDWVKTAGPGAFQATTSLPVIGALHEPSGQKLKTLQKLYPKLPVAKDASLEENLQAIKDRQDEVKKTNLTNESQLKLQTGNVLKTRIDVVRALVNQLRPDLITGKVPEEIRDPFKKEFTLEDLKTIELNTPKQKSPLLEEGGGDLRVLVEHRERTPVQRAYAELVPAAVKFVRLYGTSTESRAFAERPVGKTVAKLAKELGELGVLG